ncbi:GNAT family N-acetyltransferase [Buttiauxella ferragutiae]|uniref:GNAT family N-acetyltransferase n=1 Tax=Buttiauxella ferragutiae TaxID=82989 RepID=UPI001F538DBB|nr:GNAT family N-acetyltransferase [Buttiauxella ferragutiae]UNK63212.1 GNAT family N-acetyltransferase [Buttiauxella ferragutiae]
MHPSPRFSGQMLIKELFVSETFRGMGIGRGLMRHIAKVAQEKECLRLDWLSVKADNRAQDFYQSVGAKVIEGVNYHRLFGQAISDLAKADDLCIVLYSRC